MFAVCHVSKENRRNVQMTLVFEFSCLQAKVACHANYDVDTLMRKWQRVQQNDPLSLFVACLYLPGGKIAILLDDHMLALSFLFDKNELDETRARTHVLYLFHE